MVDAALEVDALSVDAFCEVTDCAVESVGDVASPSISGKVGRSRGGEIDVARGSMVFQELDSVSRMCKSLRTPTPLCPPKIMMRDPLRMEEWPQRGGIGVPLITGLDQTIEEVLRV